MKITEIHSLEVDPADFRTIQEKLTERIDLNHSLSPNQLQLCAGVDLSYWEEKDMEMGACSVIVMDVHSRKVVEKATSIGEVTVPYIPGFLGFRELPLVLEAVKKLEVEPDLFLFDGNGYMHPRHMGIATHASFFLEKPTIGIAKRYFKVGNVDYKSPENEKGDFTDIVINGEVCARALRTAENVKPIFVSSGNFIDLQSATEITMNMVNTESRVPIPLRLADIESRKIKKQME